MKVRSPPESQPRGLEDPGSGGFDRGRVSDPEFCRGRCVRWLGARARPRGRRGSAAVDLGGLCCGLGAGYRISR